MKPTPTNKTLYEKIKNQARKKFKVFPSAYASGWIVREYKKQGGKYLGSSRSNSGSRKSRRSKSVDGLKRWFEEEWINVCELPRIVKCGRPKLSPRNWMKNYPYCRPLKRINKSTPKTARELSKSELKRRCRSKRRSPLKKLVKSRK
jgi:hypothetical protein